MAWAMPFDFDEAIARELCEGAAHGFPAEAEEIGNIGTAHREVGSFAL